MEKKTEIILSIIILLLLIFALLIVIINPQKEKEINVLDMESVNKKNELNNNSSSEKQKINEEEEKTYSMQSGEKFCKIEDKIVYYDDEYKSIYIYNINENKTIKVITLDYELDKMYFDGTSIYYISTYYSSNKGIFKIDLEGNIQRISEEISLQLWITEEQIYFVKQIGYDQINNNPQGTLCVMDKDGNNVKELAYNVKHYFYINNNKIYYTTQTREMFQMNIDGTETVSLTQGRKFPLYASDKYLIYIDYANQEAKHILDLESKEDKILGYFGQVQKFHGKLYINVRLRSEGGTLQDDYKLLQILENGEIIDLNQYANFQTSLKYIIDDFAYIYNQNGNYKFDLKNQEKIDDEKYNDCKFYLGGYGYQINKKDIENIEVNRKQL